MIARSHYFFLFIVATFYSFCCSSLKVSPKTPIRARRGFSYEPKLTLPTQPPTNLNTANDPLTNSRALKVSKKWACIESCGACCKLELSGRPHTLSVFDNDEDKTLYMSMIGVDGWCINFNQDKKICMVYEQRPWFCRVEPDTFQDLYGTEADEMDEFCINCCQENIEDEYGSTSDVLRRFNGIIAALNSGSPIEKVDPKVLEG